MKRRPLKMLRHRIHRLAQVSVSDHALLVEATLQLIVARVQLAIVPFPRLARSMGGFTAPKHAAEISAATVLNAQKQAVAKRIGWAVASAARHLPFSAVCLPQAMAARQMLRRRHIGGVIHFGTAFGEALTLEAHAWLDVDGVEVTGYPVGKQFHEVACLVG